MQGKNSQNWTSVQLKTSALQKTVIKKTRRQVENWGKIYAKKHIWKKKFTYTKYIKVHLKCM